MSAYWTRERIVAAVLEWYAETGELPTCTEWRHSKPGVPAVTTVVERFGSWSGAMAAAGFAPRRPGGQKGVHHWT